MATIVVLLGTLVLIVQQRADAASSGSGPGTDAVAGGVTSDGGTSGGGPAGTDATTTTPTPGETSAHEAGPAGSTVPAAPRPSRTTTTGVNAPGERATPAVTAMAPSAEAAGERSGSPEPKRKKPTAPAAASVLFGVSAAGVPWDLSELDRFTAAGGKAPGLVMWYQDFAHFPDFDPSLPERVMARGAQPMLTWEPWDYTGGVDQPRYALARFIDGSHDAQIRRWAAQIKAWNKPLLLRFAHEMNGNWNSWSEGVNGNQPGQYAAAFRHVHDVFTSQGVTNVTWVWSPNVVYSNSPPLAPFYPGDAYVDRVALDGYNSGSYLSHWQAWLSFEEIFGPALSQLKTLTAKPVMVGETASTEVGGDKAAWITETFAALRNHPEIIAFTWFNHDKETDWRIQSSPAAQAAFSAAIADSRYQGASLPGG